MTVLYFIVGVSLGALLVWILYFSARREIVRIEEQKQLLQQEKHVVIEFMHNLVEAIGSGIEREKLYERIVHTSILSTGAISACLYELTEEKRLRGVVSEGLFPPLKTSLSDSENWNTRSKFLNDALQPEIYKLGEGIIGEVAQTLKPALIEDVYADPKIIKHKDPSLSISSLIVTPIAFRKKVFGVLALASHSDTMNFTENDFSLVQSLAEQAGMAINSANLMNILLEKNKLDFELTLASNIQNLLLPRTYPDTPNIQIDAYYKPAQKVGGDLYDIIELKDHKIGVVIADVSGKGIPASLLMAICQTNIRHFAQQFNSPADVLRSINREMYGEIRQDMFITMTYAIIDSKKGNITLARAGHELPLKFSFDKNKNCLSPEKIKSDGVALGMAPQNIFDNAIEDVVIPFKKGELFILYTDGVTEATNENFSEFGVESLAETIKTLTNQHPKSINMALIKAIETHSESIKNQDDLTLVTIKHT